MKKITFTFSACLLALSLFSFIPVSPGHSFLPALKSSKVVFFGMSGPNIVSANGGPYLIKLSSLPISENGNTMICGNKIQGEQYAVFPDADGNAEIELYGSSFSNLRGSQRIWVEDQYGNTLESIYVFVTN
ncbi:hypothetical protein [Pedobacter cryoconitis]|uniref:Secreted protein n=1 Tax=Pedobacter cryoconitis TaxID=188932 RepID=A0A327T846_9SPHI|nr:hypothetical protein [Pedobacter cryoconitis]RAJ37271.1 hypothetical protein LY11_00347 [Pedobacter cryoconitis]